VDRKPTKTIKCTNILYAKGVAEEAKGARAFTVSEFKLIQERGSSAFFCYKKLEPKNCAQGRDGLN
jgi:hypothetical protein